MADLTYTGHMIDKKYRIIRELGRGGMGTVYLARHLILGRHVAIKLLHGQHTRRKGALKRFYREAQASAAIGHENIIQVFDVGFTEENAPYIVMEYLRGESLASLLNRRGPVGLPLACGILEPTLIALAAAHEKGIVHRDLKPDNIFLVHKKRDYPKVKLIDFGISKFTEHGQGTQLTGNNATLGTPSFMAPEQIQGASLVNARTDVYSAGVILYLMLTGGLPFQAASLSELFMAILTGKPRLPTDVNRDFPEEALALVMKTIARNPNARPGSARELLRQLKTLRTNADLEAAMWTLISENTEDGPATDCPGIPVFEPEDRTEQGRDGAAKTPNKVQGKERNASLHLPTGPGQTVPVRPAGRLAKTLLVVASLIGIAIGVFLGRGIDHQLSPLNAVSDREPPAPLPKNRSSICAITPEDTLSKARESDFDRLDQAEKGKAQCQARTLGKKENATAKQGTSLRVREPDLKQNKSSDNRFRQLNALRKE